MDRREFLKNGSMFAGAAALPLWSSLPASAATRGDTLLVVSGQGPNSMDIHRKGTNRPSYQIAVNLYDRLVSYGIKERGDGTMMYDYQKLEPEIAESWEITADGKAAIFNLRKGATFWDGNPITADDVKWSFDRAVSVGGFPTVQMKAGSLLNKEQFEVVDAQTFKINFVRDSKLTLPDLGVPVPIIINSKEAKKHATKDDPWATEYLHRTPLGSGAYKLARWEPGQQTVYERNDDWKNGPLPAIKRVILREIPSPSTRRALLERGDTDISLDLPPKDYKELKDSGKYKVEGVPIENCLHALGLNLKFEPFKNKKVRQAIAYSIPYEEIFNVAAYGRGAPMWGGKSFKPATADWPQAFPYATDLDKAKSLLAEAGMKDGFDVPLSFNLGLAQWSEPAALLIQENLTKVGIRSTLDKIPGANWRTKALVKKELPMHLKNFGGWLNYPDYYFFWVYQNKRLFNSMNYTNPEIEELTDSTLHMATDNPSYETNVKRLIEIAFDEVPLIPLYQPNLDVAMQKNLSGYEYWFHRQLDARPIKKG